MLSTATRDAVTDLVEHIRPNHPYPDLLDRWSIHLDTQVETIGKKQKGSNLKEDSSGNVWHDVRIPEKFGPYALDFDLLAKATRIGASGWNYHTFQSEWVGIDIDGKDHGPKGNTREILDQIVHKASPLSYVEVRRSTGGSGLHLYTRLEGFPSYTREDHAKLAQLVVAKMEADMGFPLSDHLDCVGSIMWLWARDLKEGSLAPISESTETLTPEDLPEWSESAETEDPPPTPTPEPDTGQDPDPYDVLAGDLSADQQRIIRDLTALGCCNYVPEFNCYQTHTVLLAKVEHVGPFGTNSKGENLTDPNCYLTPSGTGFKVKRFGNGDLNETKGWTVGEDGKPWRSYNLREYPPAETNETNETTEEPQPKTFPTIRLTDLLTDEYRQDWFITDAFAMDQHGLLVGSFKTLKTTIALDLGISIAANNPFLGEMPIENSGPVLMFSGESGASSLQGAARRIVDAKGIKEWETIPFHLCPYLKRMDNARNLQILEETTKDIKPRLLIVDPAYLSFGGDGSSDIAVRGETLSGISSLCQHLGITLLIVHHTKKTVQGFNIPQMGDTTGAGYVEWARQWFLLGRQCAYVPGTGHHSLYLSLGGSAGHSAIYELDVDEGVLPDRCWDVRLQRHGAAKKERQMAEAEEIRRQLISAAEDHPEGATKTKIIKGSSLRMGQVARGAFDSLVEDGTLIRTSIKTKTNSNQKAYHLNTKTIGSGNA